MTIVEQYRRWFEYEKDSHARVLAALDAVPEDARSGPAFAKAVDILTHIIAARLLWLYRLGRSEERPTSLFAGGLTLAQARDQLAAMHADWDRYFAKLDENGAQRVLEYRALEGEWYRTAVHDILAQMHGHSCYHRGQIASLMRSAGWEPAVTDFIFWAREEIAPPLRAEG